MPKHPKRQDKAKPTAADKRLARKIAQELFTDGSNRRAHRLVSQMSENDNVGLKERGGWGEQPMADYIAAILSAARVERKRKGKR